MKYKILKDFITPCFTIRAGCVKTVDEWFKIFEPHGFLARDLNIKSDWFELCKEPLLITRDKKEIYYGDYFFWVDRDLKWHKECAGRFTKKKQYSQAYSCLKEAEKYIHSKKELIAYREFILMKLKKLINEIEGDYERH